MNRAIALAIAASAFPSPVAAGQTPSTSASPVASPSPAPARPIPCAAPVHRHFDFWVGEWDVVNPAGAFAGSSRIERQGDCTILETWASSRGSYVGRSLNAVGADGKWRQIWTDTSGAWTELVGGLVDGKMVLEGDGPAQASGGPARNRITWSPEPGGVVRQLWETSLDGGRTWATSFDGRYHRASGNRSLPDGFFAKLGGSWIGTGVVNRRDGHVEFDVRKGVGRTIRFEWRNVIVGEPRLLFEGSAVYEIAGDGAVTGTWWDSQGAKHAIVATLGADGSSLSSDWGPAGRSVYTVAADGSLEVVDSIRRPTGEWVEFGRTKLRRK
jgi:hypothetical protein